MTNCKYKFHNKEKFNGKPFCTCFCELCENLPICEDNCQIFEDLKELEKYKRAFIKINDLILNPPLKLYGDNKNVDI